jgi:hypothetical protein
MVKRLVILALVNVAIAIGFLMPAVFWTIADYRPSGSLKVTLPTVDRTQEFLADIRATNDIEKLRRQAAMLTEMRSLDQKTRDIEVQVMNRLFQWFWILMVGCGSAFLVNAGAIWWLTRRPSVAAHSAL